MAMADAVGIIKGAILRAQAQAARSSNAVSLSLYYGIGRFVSLNSRNGYWGTGAIETISQRLRQELPGLRGYSAQNIRSMRSFYEEWELLTKCSPLASELQLLENKIESGKEVGERALLTINRSPMASELDLQEFVSISFTHHMEIIHKTSAIDERIYYIHQTCLHR